MIQYRMITGDNFTETGLDGFDWSPERKRETAARLLSGKYFAWGAFENGRLVGFTALDRTLQGDRMVLSDLHVDRAYRRQGIGHMLFSMALTTGMAYKVKKLYISVSSDEETVAFFKAMGCSITDSPIPALAEAGPLALQMDCPIR